MKRRASRTLIATLQIAGLAAGLGAAGCASAPEKPYMAKTNLDMHPVTVRQESARLEIPVAPEDVALKPQDLRALSVFVSEYKERGRGALVVSLPAKAPNAEAAVRVSGDLRKSLYDLSIDSNEVAGGTYDAAGAPAPIVVSFERYKADDMKCPSYGESNAAVSWDNKPSPAFGCAVNANIAAMLVDPGDVVAPPAMDASDAGRRSAVFDKYRRGLPTATERSSGEKGVISTAVRE